MQIIVLLQVMDADGSLNPLSLDILDGNEQGHFAINGYVTMVTDTLCHNYNYMDIILVHALLL